MFEFLRKRKKFFSDQENAQIVEAIRNAELRTSGEIRIYVESHCRYMDPMDQAAEVFFSLKMQNTADRNAVLLYIAMKDRQLAIFGDEGIYKKAGKEYWERIVKHLLSNFNKENYGDGISSCVKEIGEALQNNFPFDKATDKNELPDEIVFGK